MSRMRNTPIDVEELLQRIRQEADCRARAGITIGVEAGADPLPFPPVMVPPDHPILYASDLEVSKTGEKLRELLQRATRANNVNRWIPKPLRRLFRNQGRVNAILLDTFQLLVKSEVRALRN